MSEPTGTALYHRMLVAEYATPNQQELVCEVWKPTPWVYDVKTGDRYEEIRRWCNTNLGHESSPIHSQPGQWHFASVTMRGWTWVGFATETIAKRFQAAFPVECALPTEQVAARERAKA